MDIHILCHGLGNQLSQYAFFLDKRARKQRAHAFYAFTEHNGFELERIFGLPQGLPWYLQFVRVAFRLGLSRRFYSARTAELVLSMLRIRIVLEPEGYSFDPALLEPWSGIRILFGGWHDPRYFEHSARRVRETFTFPSFTDPENLAVAAQIDARESVSIHVRRGDYLKPQNRALFGDIATAAYYRNAIARVATDAARAGRAPTFFVFSDDMAWCRTHLGLPDAVFVAINSGGDSWKDMALMARCRTNIIANSTFSWWAAWLNRHSDRAVFCPTRFANTELPGQAIYPPEWRRIEG